MENPYRIFCIFLIYAWVCSSSNVNANSIQINDTTNITLSNDSISKPKLITNNSDTLFTETSDSLIVTPQNDSIIIISCDSILHKDSVVFSDSIISKEVIKIDTLSIIMVGDVMLGTNYPSSTYLPPGNNCNPLLDPVKEYILDADISFCNLEGVFAGNAGTPKKCNDPKLCYVFRMPDEYVNCIVEAGFNLVSVANNHVNDFGFAGRMNSVIVLQDAGLNFAGFNEFPYTIFEKSELIIGFTAFSPNNGVMDLRNITQAESIVRQLNDTCDIIIVSMHGGAEGRNHQHVPRTNEIFLGANRGNVYEFAHRMIDAGADIIIGHGPHVTRAMELYKNRFIAYSLGNFATYSRFNITGPNGIAPLVNIKVDAEGNFIGGKITPIMQEGEGGAKIDPNNRAIFKLQYLNQSDFPDNLLVIDNAGNIHSLSIEF